MKKPYHIIYFLIVLTLGACSKSNNKVDLGSWTFKSNKYQVSFANPVRNSFVAYTGDNLPSGSLLFNFADSVRVGNDMPRARTYFITNRQDLKKDSANAKDSLYVYMNFSDTSFNRYYIPSSYTKESITVTKSDKGIVTISIPPVMFFNTSSPGDSALLQGTIIQGPQ
jgi:hypothetical protein